MASTLSSPTTTSFLPKSPQLSSFQKQPNSNSIRFACTKIACNINTSNNETTPTSLVCDRRNILIGLGGMYCGTAIALAGYPAKVIAAETLTFPKPLNTVVKTTVPRPEKSRTRDEKEEYEEVLDIEFIIGQAKQYITFDVYVNDDDEHTVDEKTVIKSQYAGSFTSLGQKEGDSVGVMDGAKKKGNLKLALSRLLEDIGASDDNSIEVTIVPNAGAAQSIQLTGVSIQFTAD